MFGFRLCKRWKRFLIWSCVVCMSGNCSRNLFRTSLQIIRRCPPGHRQRRTMSMVALSWVAGSCCPWAGGSCCICSCCCWTAGWSAPSAWTGLRHQALASNSALCIPRFLYPSKRFKSPRIFFCCNVISLVFRCWKNAFSASIARLWLNNLVDRATYLAVVIFEICTLMFEYVGLYTWFTTQKRIAWCRLGSRILTSTRTPPIIGWFSVTWWWISDNVCHILLPWRELIGLTNSLLCIARRRWKMSE